MSIFSEVLNQYIQEKEIKISPLAKYCDTDRSTMYKIISGKRNPPSPELFHKISDFMHLNPTELQKLEEAWKITLTGHDVYYRRKSVENFISRFPSPSPSALPPQPVLLPPEESPAGTDTTSALTSQQQVSFFLHRMLLTESLKKSGRIGLLLQPDYNFLFNLLTSLKPSGSLSIRHLLCLSSQDRFTEDHELYNLRCLREIFPLYMAGLDYEPRFFYDHIQSHYYNFNVFPCLILTSDYALMCSSDYQHGIFYNDQKILKLLWEQYLTYYDKCSPLFAKAPITPDTHKAFLDALPKATDRDTLIAIQPEICLTPFLTGSLLREIFNHSIPNGTVILDSAEAIFKNNRRLAELGQFLLYFTESGAAHFARTGIIEEIPEVFYSPLTPGQRIQVLKGVLSCCQKGAYRILKEPMNHLPANLRLLICGQVCQLTFVNNNNESILFTIQESGFLTTFRDYLENLRENCYRTCEESTEIIRKLIDQLEAGEPSRY